MGRPAFAHADFLRVARELAAEHGPPGVTVLAVSERLSAPSGSFYHRFASRDTLLGELWLENVLSFQEGFVAKMDLEGGLAAALHVVDWAREHPDEARILLLYNREDFFKGEWPLTLKRGVEAQTRVLEGCLNRFSVKHFGRKDSSTLRRSAFVLLEVPTAAVRPHLRRREQPPPIVDVLIRETFKAIVRRSGAR